MQAYLGTILPVAFTFAPRGWALCYGQLMSISQNSALFSLLGTTYGGNGVQTFGLPDLRGRVAVGQGQGPGTSMYVLGQMGGTEQVSLTINNLPSHTHAATFTPAGGGGSATVTVKASALQATESVPGTNGATTLAAPYYTDGGATVAGYVADANPGVTLTGVTATGGGGGGGTVTNALSGNSLPTPIIQPYLCVNYIIALTGIFPSRN